MKTSSSTAADTKTTGNHAPAPLSEKRQKRAGEIFAAARQVFIEKGFQKAAVSEIAQRAGIAEGLIFRYFPTKRDLLHEVLSEMYEPLIRDVEEGFSRLQGLRARLRFIIWRHVRVYAETPGLARLVLHEVRTGPDYAGSGLHALQVRYTQFAQLALIEAVKDGELAAGVDTEAARAMLYGGLEHLMWPVLFGNQSVNVDAVTESYTNLMLHGLQATSPETGVEARLSRLESLFAAAERGKTA